MENPELGSATVLNQWEKEGRKLTKWELCRVVKELRKYKRYERALEVIIRKKKEKKKFAFNFIWGFEYVCFDGYVLFF